MKKQLLRIYSLLVIIILVGWYYLTTNFPQFNSSHTLNKDNNKVITGTLQPQIKYTALLLADCAFDEEILNTYQEEIEKFNTTHTKIQLQLKNAKITDIDREEQLHGNDVEGFDTTCAYTNMEQARQAIALNIQYFNFYEDPLWNVMGIPCEQASNIRFKETHLTLKACNEGGEKVGDEGKMYDFDEAQTLCKGVFYLPSASDWETLLSALRIENNTKGSEVMQTVLREYNIDLPNQIDMNAYWSSTAKADDFTWDLYHQAYYLLVDEGLVMVASDSRNQGFSVRCFKKNT